MGRQHFYWIASVLAICVATSQAQSLGDMARQQQQKKQDSANVSKKVLTNEDFSDSSPGPRPQPGIPKNTPPKYQDDSKPASGPSAEEWKAKIQQKKDVIAELQKRIDKLQGSVHYVENNRNVYTNAPEYNQRQDRKQQMADELKAKLSEQQSELKDLQEQAREAGFGNSVYQ